MDHLDRLRQINENNERVDPSAYANLVRQALRSSPLIAREFLQQTYEKGLQEAYATRTPGALGKVALMGAEQLNAVGEQAGAIARLDQAAQMSVDDPISRARILGMRAAWQAFSSDPLGAPSILIQAREALPREADTETTVGLENHAAIISLVLFEDDAPEKATAAVSVARSNEFDWMASATMVLLIGTLASSPDVNQAIAWADALHGYAASLPHPAREFDATVAQLALRARRRLEAPPAELDEVGRSTFNNTARWRLAVLRLYSEAIRGSQETALAAASALERRQSEINSGYTVASAGFGAFVEAHFGSGAVPSLAVPESASALMVSGALASAEAVAVGGSQSVAADWLRWFETELPAAVVSSLEWPSCRRRVEGLLLLRLGREREAVTRLQDGVRCCEERGDDIQEAIGRVQLSEALLRGSTASMLPAAHARSLREVGVEKLRSLDIDPIPFAYAASRTFLRDEQLPERGGLTPREAQVLGRLAQGMTYREIGADLGINSRTVGVHASHCYEKLGVRNRVEAVKLAQDLGIV